MDLFTKYSKSYASPPAQPHDSPYLDSPYPSEREKKVLRASTHLTAAQLNNWCVTAMLQPTKTLAQ